MILSYELYIIHDAYDVLIIVFINVMILIDHIIERHMIQKYLIKVKNLGYF